MQQTRFVIAAALLSLLGSQSRPAVAQFFNPALPMQGNGSGPSAGPWRRP